MTFDLNPVIENNNLLEQVIGEMLNARTEDNFVGFHTLYGAVGMPSEIWEEFCTSFQSSGIRDYSQAVQHLKKVAGCQTEEGCASSVSQPNDYEETDQNAAQQKAEAARQQAEADEAARKEAEKKAARKKAEAEAEAARKKAEAEAEAARKNAEAEAARKNAEAEAARKNAEAEAARKNAEAEAEAARQQAEADEAAREAEKAEAARKEAEKEAARKNAEAEAEAARIEAEAEEAARIEAEAEAARQQTEAENAAREEANEAEAELQAASASALASMQSELRPDAPRDALLDAEVLDGLSDDVDGDVDGEVVPGTPTSKGDTESEDSNASELKGDADASESKGDADPKNDIRSDNSADDSEDDGPKDAHLDTLAELRKSNLALMRKVQQLENRVSVLERSASQSALMHGNVPKANKKNQKQSQKELAEARAHLGSIMNRNLVDECPLCNARPTLRSGAEWTSFKWPQHFSTAKCLGEAPHVTRNTVSNFPDPVKVAALEYVNALNKKAN